MKKEKLIHTGIRLPESLLRQLEKIALDEASNTSIVIRRILKKNLPKEFSNIDLLPKQKEINS